MARDLTGDEKAANGPLPGGLSVAGAEHRGSASNASLGCHPSLNGAEISGADRSGDGLADLALLGAGARVLLGAVRLGWQRSGTAQGGAGASDDDG